MTQPAPDVEPYPSEMPRLKEAMENLNRRFQNKRFDEETMVQFMEAARDIFGEIGWLVGVDWFDAQRAIDGVPSPLVGVPSQVIPRVILQGRVTPEEETDHDRLRHEIVTGQADGIKGYIREGSSDLHEDPISKTIY